MFPAILDTALISKRSPRPILRRVLQPQPEREQHAVADDGIQDRKEDQEHHGELDRVHAALRAWRAWSADRVHGVL